MKHMETCYLVEPGSASSLREAILFLESHPEDVERIGRNARRLVEIRYNAHAFAKRLEQEIRRLLG